MTDVTLAVKSAATHFVEKSVLTYLAVPGNEQRYPGELVDEMASHGFFGMNIASNHGGSELALPDSLAVTRILGSGWQSLAGLLGTHLRAALYFAQIGTPEQQQSYLPQMAAGDLVFGHAYHEAHEKDAGGFTTIYDPDAGTLSGTKHWSTNAAHADRIIVIARTSQEPGLAAIVVDPSRDGVRIGPELDRVGMYGVSLCELSLDRYRVAPADVIGGPGGDVPGFMARFRRGSALAFAARAVGSAQALVAHAHDEIVARSIPAGSNEVVSNRFAELALRLSAIESSFEQAVSAPDGLTYSGVSSLLAKVFCSRELQAVAQDALMLSGGGGYATEFPNHFARHYRDAAALQMIDTPNDIMVSRVGDELLDRVDRDGTLSSAD